MLNCSQMRVTSPVSLTALVVIPANYYHLMRSSYDKQVHVIDYVFQVYMYFWFVLMLLLISHHFSYRNSFNCNWL